MTRFDEFSDVIDSRDVIERIEELQGIRAEHAEDEEQPDLSEEEAEELKALEALAEEASDSPDWKYGEALIRDSYFREYAEQLAEDIGAIPKDTGWPSRCIDWEQAAQELQMDYFQVDFAGVGYWIRN